MPPTKKTPKPTELPKDSTAPSTADVFVLFAKNLEEIRRWYRGASDSGHPMGHVVLNEIVLANVSTALQLAMRGKAWEKPVGNP